RLELILQRPEKAMILFEGLLKTPENVAHATLIAALFGMVDAYVHLKAPDAGTDLIEDFINRYPGDPDLSVLFARLDDLYRAERKPSRSDLEKWVQIGRASWRERG